MPARRKTVEDMAGEFEELGGQQALAGRLSSKIDDLGRAVATKKLFSIPEAGVFMAGGTTIPYHGPLPAAAGAITGIGAMRAHAKSKLLRRILGKHPFVPLALGSAGGFIAGSKLSN